jgi:Tol biopolymer transport system component
MLVRIFACLAIVVVTTTHVQAAGKIAFIQTTLLVDNEGLQSDDFTREEIYVMNDDGTGKTNLTNFPEAIDAIPSWSPDGRKIAFASNRDGAFNLYIMNADGGNQIKLTDDTAFDREPTWSPDGSKLAFFSDRDGTIALYVIQADGSDIQKLIDIPGGAFISWSPDGTQIVIQQSSVGDPSAPGIGPSPPTDIMTINADGTNLVNLTNDGLFNNGRPSWSPDGTRIVFQSNRNGSISDIFVMNADGSNLINLTDDVTSIDTNPSWSSDGSKIVFASSRDGFEHVPTDGFGAFLPPDGLNLSTISDIFVMNTDGSGQINLTQTPSVNEDFPVWSMSVGSGASSAVKAATWGQLKADLQ